MNKLKLLKLTHPYNVVKVPIFNESVLPLRHVSRCFTTKKCSKKFQNRLLAPHLTKIISKIYFVHKLSQNYIYIKIKNIKIVGDHLSNFYLFFILYTFNLYTH